MADCPELNYCSMLECVMAKAGEDAFADNTIYTTLLNLQSQINELKTNRGVLVQVEGKAYSLPLSLSNDQMIGIKKASVIVPTKGVVKKIAQMLVETGSFTIEKESTTSGVSSYSFTASTNSRIIDANISVEAGDILTVSSVQPQVSKEALVRMRESFQMSPVDAYMMEGLNNLFIQTGTQPKDANEALVASQSIEITNNYACITFYIQEDSETIVIAGKSL